jgi:hypothetical protein
MDFLLMRLSLVCEQCFVQVCLGHLRLRLVIESSAWLVMLHLAPRYCALLKTVPQRGSKTATHFRATQGHAQRGPDVVIDIPSSGLRPDGEQMCAGVMNMTSLTLQVQHVTHRQQDNMMNPMVPSCVRTCHQTFCLPSTPWPLCHSCYVVSDVAHVPITPAWRLLGSHFQQRSLVLSTRALRDAQPWTETVLEVDA